MFWRFWDCIGLLLGCFGLCCAALWCECVGVVAECVGLFGIVQGCLGVLELFISVQRNSENNKKCNGYYRIKKDSKKRCKLLKLLELLGYLLALCFGIFWQLLATTLMKFETLSANVPDRTRQHKGDIQGLVSLAACRVQGFVRGFYVCLAYFSFGFAYI